MMFNNFDYSAAGAVFVLPLLVVLLIAPFAPGGAFAGKFRGRAVVVANVAFAAYLAVAMALVFLPLPADPAALCTATGGNEGFSFVPFRWVGGIAVFMEGQGQRLTLQGFLHNDIVGQVLANFGLFLPLGVALRLLFGLRRRTAFGVAFALSLAIEVVQGTGMLGMLPCAHRLGDVDDLMLNVLGGVVGWIVAGFLRPAANVRFGHRVIAFAADLAVVEAVLIVLNAVLGPFLPAPYAVAFVVTAAVLIVLPAVATGGVTLGKWMTGIRLVGRGGAPLPVWRIVPRYALLLGVPAALFLWPQLVLPPETNDVTTTKAVVFAAELAVLLLLGPGLMLLRGDRRGLHDLVAASDHRPLGGSPAGGGG